MKGQVKGKAEELKGKATGDKSEELKGKARQAADRMAARRVHPISAEDPSPRSWSHPG